MSDVGNQNGAHGDNRADNVDESQDIRVRDAETLQREKRAPRKAATVRGDGLHRQAERRYIGHGNWMARCWIWMIGGASGSQILGSLSDFLEVAINVWRLGRRLQCGGIGRGAWAGTAMR
jgi:hypothetical protein